MFECVGEAEFDEMAEMASKALVNRSAVSYPSHTTTTKQENLFMEEA